jgi:hypothetical protein
MWCLPIPSLLSDIRDGVTLIPGRLAQRCSIDGDIDIQHDSFAVAHAPQASLQCRREIAGAFYLFTFQAVSFCDFGELDVRISEITIEVLAGLVKYRR